jgi:hypothetical protein
MNYGQVGALSFGQRVTAYEKKNEWIRISANSVAAQAPATAAPSSAQDRWVNASYVKNGAVNTGNSAATLAVRSGPGINFSLVDTLSNGQKVTVVENRNGWIRITPATSTAVASASRPASVTGSSVPAAPRPVVVTAPPPRPVVTRPPVYPPVDNLVMNGDFSGMALALPSASGDSTAELSGRWLRSVTSAWEISPAGGNLGSYVRAAASQEAGRLLYVASDAKRSKGSYVLRFDYILTGSSDALGVKVFVSDRDIVIGTDGGDIRMNSSQRAADLTMLPASTVWATYYLPVELGDGYNYVYVLFVGNGTGNTGIDNISLSPRRR